VHRIRNKLTGKGKTHGAGNRHTSLLLRLIGRGTEVWSDKKVRQFDQLTELWWLAHENVETCCSNLALSQSTVQCLFIDDATAASVHDAQSGLDLGELFITEHTRSFRGF